MIYKRIISSLLLSNKKLLKGKKFQNHKFVGNPSTFCKSLGAQKSDEIFLCDLDSYNNSSLEPDYETLKKVCNSTMTPLTFGGGINTLNKVKKTFLSGADKVYLNTHLFTDINIINKIASIYGSQSIVAGINIIKFEEKYKIFDKEKNNLIDWLMKLEDSGAGEIKINFVDRDGSGKGFYLDCCKKLISLTDLPIIFEGGLGSLEQIKDALNAGVNSIALGSMISFGDYNIYKIKQYLKNEDFNVR